MIREIKPFQKVFPLKIHKIVFVSFLTNNPYYPTQCENDFNIIRFNKLFSSRYLLW